LLFVGGNCVKIIYGFKDLFKRNIKFRFGLANNKITTGIQNKYNDYKMLRDNSYTVPELKEIAKEFLFKFKQKKKKEMVLELYNYLYKNYCIKKIQKVWSNYFIKLFNKLQGPAYLKRSICNNVEDFLTTEEIKDIDYYYFFSYKDIDGFVYGFNLISIHNLIIKKDTKNPYTRNLFSLELIENVQKRINYNKILKKINQEIVTIEQTNNYNSSFVTLFQKIDLLGNYTQAEWIINLNNVQLRRFLLELYDIWDYRSQLSIEMKLAICPPTGMPFREIPVHILQRNFNVNIDLLKKFAITIIDKLINSSNNRDNQSLGAMYILSALTIVNNNAAEAMPWLYQSVL
jgi:hypothetical protein